MWYLFSLLVWRLFKMFVIDKLPLFKPFVWIVFSVTVAIVSGFIPLTYHFAFQRTCTFFPFFVMGLYTPKDYFDKLKTLNKTLPFLLLIIIAIAVICLKVDLSAVIASPQSYPFYGESKIISCIYRIVFVATACITGVCVIALCPDNNFMAKQGKYSMVYYLYHGFFVLLLKFLIDRFGLPYGSVFLLLYSIPIIVILFLFSKTRLSLFLLNPCTKLWKKK